MSSSSFVFSHDQDRGELERELRYRKIGFTKLADHLYQTDSVDRLIWAQDIWHAPMRLAVQSVADAQKKLRDLKSQRAWAHVTTAKHRRGQLILEGLKHIRTVKPLVGWESARPLEHSAFTLLESGDVIACLEPRERFPGGKWIFQEDKKNPPSRAYLKLWEWGHRTVRLPKKGDLVLDLGASPGGWTWVLREAGLNVHAYDRSPLHDSLRAVPFFKGDAFSITVEREPQAKWVFCDVIADPKKTLELIESWAKETKVGLVFTIKFKGAADFLVCDRLAKIANSNLAHLYVNRNEVTFWRV